MPDDQVTIDPEFEPSPPSGDPDRRFRAVAIAGVVMAAFAFGWLMRTPEQIEPEPVEEYALAGTTSTTAIEETAASPTTRPSTTTTTEAPSTIGLLVPLEEAVPGFTDIIIVEHWNEAGFEVARWRPTASAPETILAFGHDEPHGFAGLDASGSWYATQDENGVLSVHRLSGADPDLEWFPNLQAVGVRVASLAWHDTEPGLLAWLTCSRTPGGPGTLFRLDVADGVAEPATIRRIDKVCAENAGTWLQGWGDWGFVLGVSEGEQFETVRLAPDGGEIASVGNGSADAWMAAASPVGTIWTEDGFDLRPSSFLLSPDGESRMPVPGLAEGELLEDARWSPDSTRLALSVRSPVTSNLVVRIVEPQTDAIVAEITEIADSNTEIGLGAWSTDSRFLLVDRWLCPDGCGYTDPQGRELAFYDTHTDTTTTIGIPLDGGWGEIRLTDPTTPAVLLAHYPLDGGAADLVEDPDVRTVFGATPTNDRFGIPDAAYAFDGENARIIIDTESQLGTDTVSITAWIKMHEDAGPRPVGEWWDIVSYGGQGHVLAIQGEGAILAGLKGTAANCEFMGSDSVFDGNWHHVAMTRDATWDIRVYLDGVVQAITPHTLDPAEAVATTGATCATAPAVRDSVWIGADPGLREYFHGSIDEVRIYSGTLTEDEIAALATDVP